MAATSGEWLVEVNPINDYVDFEIKYLKDEGAVSLCRSTSEPYCTVTVKQSGDLLLTVSRSISSSSK